MPAWGSALDVALTGQSITQRVSQGQLPFCPSLFPLRPSPAGFRFPGFSAGYTLHCCGACLWQLALSPHPEQPKYWASHSHANTVQDDCPATPTPAVTNTAQVTGRACTWPPAADPETQGSAAACPPKPADTGLQGQDFLLGWGRVSEVPSPPLRRGQKLPRNTQSPKVQPQFIHSPPRSITNRVSYLAQVWSPRSR